MATIKTSPVPFNPDTYMDDAKSPATLPALRAALLAQGECDAAAFQARVAEAKAVKYDAAPHIEAFQRDVEDDDEGMLWLLVMGLRIVFAIAIVAVVLTAVS